MKKLPLFFTAVLLLLSIPAAAMDTLVVTTDYWPPFRIKGESGVTGIDIDLMNAIGKRMGVQVQFRIEPWARCLLDMEHGNADIMTGLAKTPERERYIIYTSPSYFTCAPAFYERAARTGRPIRTYKDLKDVAVGFTRGSAYFEPFDSDKKLPKVPVANEELLLNMLAEGRLDVIIGTDCQVEYDLARNKLGQSIRKVPFRPEKRILLYIGMSKLSRFRSRIGEIENILDEMVHDGTVKAIAQKYIGTEHE